VRSSKQRNLNRVTFPLENQPTGLLTAINSLTYWTSVTKGIPRDSALPMSCFDLSSDHSPVLITLSPSVLNQAHPPRLCNSKTNWDYFRNIISTNLTLHVSLKTDSQIEDAVKYFNDIKQWAGWNATPDTTYTPSSYTCPILMKQKLAERRLRREWQRTRIPTT
jgi:hypothetical protein